MIEDDLALLNKWLYLGTEMRMTFICLVTVLSIISSIEAQDRVRVETAYPLFQKLLTNPQDEHLWSAIYDYWKTADGFKGEFFDSDCYDALKKDPLIFYRRYIKGDDKALELMLAAFSYDYTAFEKRNERTPKAEIRRVYEKAITKMETIKKGSSFRHKRFIEDSKNALTSWDEVYKHEP